MNRPDRPGMVDRPTALLNFSSGSLLGFNNPSAPPSFELNDARFREVQEGAGVISIRGIKTRLKPEDLRKLADIGNGSCGQVTKYSYEETVMAVKQMARINNPETEKRIFMDLSVVTKTGDCPFIVTCYGYFILETEVRVCMELMATCLDLLLKNTNNRPFPEPIIGKMNVSILSALHYLKEKHNVIHRDVKPSNILLDYSGNVKLCDFGISGTLTESLCFTKNAGCPPYMAPERLQHGNAIDVMTYDVRSDVWSLGITLVELARGRYPYPGNDFEIQLCILQQPAPILYESEGFTPLFCHFVELCLRKDVLTRPKFKHLIDPDHPFIAASRVSDADVADWFSEINMLEED